MSVDSLCAACGHPRREHVPEFFDGWGPSGSPYHEGFYARCGHEDLRSVERGYYASRCPCPLYVHDCFPLVTELLGFDARSAIERATGARPVPRTIPMGDYQEGDLITVSYGGITKAHRVRRVLPDVHDGRVYELELDE